MQVLHDLSQDLDKENRNEIYWPFASLKLLE